MKYNHDLWNEYTEENENSFQKELGDFIYHTSLTLGATKILELGCNAGNNLRSFPTDYDVNGLDMNKVALEKAKKTYANFKFHEGSLLDIPFENSQFDLVFTRGVLIHINQSDMDLAVKEMVRVSKKWIFNLEYFGEDGKCIDWKRGDDLLWYRDMNKRWKEYDVEIISEMDLPQNIDIGKTRFTLIKKN